MAEVTLADWVRRTSGEPFQPGHSECAGWALRWVGEVRGADVSPWMCPAGRKPDEHVAASGGILAMAIRAATALGLPQVAWADQPRRGDVGVLDVQSRDGMIRCCGIATALDGRWAVKNRNNVMFVKPQRVIAAWRV
jgi:hypothetical protein